MRRGFLDKRSCIETTFKLKYEKEQEVNNAISCLFTIVDKYFPFLGKLATEYLTKTHCKAS